MDDDFYHVIDLLNNYNVRYLVIGGAALKLHGFNRNPRDYDIWLDINQDNVIKTELVFKELGSDFLGFELEDLIRQKAFSPIVETIFSFSPSKIDFRLRAHGKTFEECFSKLVLINNIKVISIEDLDIMKKETLRPVDEQDLQLIKTNK